MRRLNGNAGSSAKTSDDFVGMAELSGSDTDADFEEKQSIGTGTHVSSSDGESVMSETKLRVPNMKPL